MIPGTKLTALHDVTLGCNNIKKGQIITILDSGALEGTESIFFEFKELNEVFSSEILESFSIDVPSEKEITKGNWIKKYEHRKNG